VNDIKFVKTLVNTKIYDIVGDYNNLSVNERIELAKTIDKLQNVIAEKQADIYKSTISPNLTNSSTA
jgi:hypothetical protein